MRARASTSHEHGEEPEPSHIDIVEGRDGRVNGAASPIVSVEAALVRSHCGVAIQCADSRGARLCRHDARHSLLENQDDRAASAARFVDDIAAVAAARECDATQIIRFQARIALHAGHCTLAAPTTRSRGSAIGCANLDL